MSRRFGAVKPVADRIPHDLRVPEISALFIAEQDVQRSGLQERMGSAVVEAMGRGLYSVGADERPGAAGCDVCLYFRDRVPWRKPHIDREAPIEGADARQEFGGAIPGSKGPGSQ
jgi:hypothetical protein